MTDKVAVFKKCRCGYHIIVYVTAYESGKPSYYHYFDGHSGDYRQCYVCPGCKDRIDYLRLEG
jgi:hypothetical protein